MLKKILNTLKAGWMKFAHILGRINTTILLTILYFVIIGIYALIAKLLFFVIFPFKKKSGTYWKDRLEKFEISSTKHPF